MEIRIEPVPAAQKSVLRQMLELYLYDFSEFSKEDLAENGYFRRHGVGKAAAFRIFDRFPGSWEVTQWVSNLPAQRFWEKVVTQYTGGQYRAFSVPEKEVVGFTFTAPPCP